MRAEATDDRKRWLALYVLCAAALMIVLDGTVVNVALPSIKDELGFSQASLAWVVNAYMIAFGSLLLLSGRLGDLIGHRRVFLLGLCVFTAASLLCAVAQTQGMLVVARFVQGAGGALTSAVVLGMIVTMFPERREQAKAIGVYGFVASAGGSLGLLAGGVLTEAINWHWIFFINVPIGALAALLTLRLVPNPAGIGLDAGLDLAGAAMLTGGLMVGVYAILGVEQHGWGATRTLALGAVALALLVAFVARQATIANPLVPLRLFRARSVTGANLVLILFVVGMSAMFFMGALYMQQILGYDPLEVGLAFLPGSLIMGVMSLGVAGPLAMRFGARRVLVGCLLSMGGAILLFARTPVDGTFLVDLLPINVLFGVGAGLAFPVIMQLAMSDATPSDAGLASGIVNTAPPIGGAVGLAVLATVAADRTETLLARGEAPLAALNGGFHAAYLVGAALLVMALAVALTVLRSSTGAVPPPGHGEPVADEAPAAAEPAYSEA